MTMDAEPADYVYYFVTLPHVVHIIYTIWSMIVILILQN